MAMMIQSEDELVEPTLRCRPAAAYPSKYTKSVTMSEMRAANSADRFGMLGQFLANFSVLGSHIESC